MHSLRILKLRSNLEIAQSVSRLHTKMRILETHVSIKDIHGGGGGGGGICTGN